MSEETRQSLENIGRPTLAEVAADSQASAIHHADATADTTYDSDDSFFAEFPENWADQLTEADLDEPGELETAKTQAIADQAEQDAPASHVVEEAQASASVDTVPTEGQFLEARRKLQKTVSEPRSDPSTVSEPRADPSTVSIPESDEEDLPDADEPQSDETATDMPIEEADAPVTAPSADDSVPADVEQEANLSMDVDEEELRAREEAKADEIKRSQPVDVDIDDEGDAEAREERQGSEPVDLDIDVEGDKEAAKIRKQEEKLRKKAESLAEKERVHRESFWSKRNFKDQEEYDLASQAVAMDIDLDDNGKVKPEDVAVVTEALLQTYKSQYADLRKSLRLLKKTRAKQQDKPKEMPGWHFLEGQTRIWTNPYAISAVAAYPRGEGFQSRYGPKKVFGIEQ